MGKCGNKCSEGCNKGCRKKSSNCYKGFEVECLNIKPGDSYDSIIKKLGDYICEQGFQEDGIDHISFLESTGTPSNQEGQAGETDTYVVWRDEEETSSLGTFVVYNGTNSETIEGTYAQLKSLADGGLLTIGNKYVMTDFQTIYDQPDYSSVDIPKTSVVTKAAAVDPIVLLAISATEFAKEVWRPSTPRHTLKYDINFIETEVMAAPAKGRITYCKDEFNNETHYDHTVVLLKRYESVSGSGIFNSFWDTGFASIEVLTFGAGSFSNKIGDNYYELVGGFAVSNNVFASSIGSSIGNSIGIRSNNNTFGDGTNNNTFGNNTDNNTFGNSTRNNTFGNLAYSNTFGSNTDNNTFGNNTQSNIFGDGTNNNTFGNNTDNNTFGYGTYYNTFGEGTYYNTFGNSTNYNTFGNNIQSVDFTITPTPIHVYGNYPCNIFERQDGTIRLSYYDNTDTLLVVDPTD